MKALTRFGMVVNRKNKFRVQFRNQGGTPAKFEFFIFYDYLTCICRERFFGYEVFLEFKSPRSNFYMESPTFFILNILINKNNLIK